MGLIGIIIAVIILIIIYAFTYLSGSPSTLTPEKTNQIQSEAQEVMDQTAEKTRQQEDQIKKINP
jgi:predicted metalloprotease